MWPSQYDVHKEGNIAFIWFKLSGLNSWLIKRYGEVCSQVESSSWGFDIVASYYFLTCDQIWENPASSHDQH